MESENRGREESATLSTEDHGTVVGNACDGVTRLMGPSGSKVKANTTT